MRTVPETGSTNADCLTLAGAGAPEGCWLRADRQTGGRGRQGRTWQSPPGNLYASTIVRLRSWDPSPPSLALVAAGALHEAVGSLALLGDRLRIKWPNDLLIDRAKLSGILMERSGDAVVIGFGVNLAHAPSLTDRATIALSATGFDVAPQQLVEVLAATFARWLGRWRDRDLAETRADWLARAHPVGTALSTHLPDGSRISGLFRGIDPAGALMLATSDQGVMTIHAGDVFLV
ncbi:biotin--[acetyl-CoA-carboxylase] ligase [Sphingomonas sp. FW199]|uniref:biotin--[acetyl-CoA-carboxylase] ligase n=1 Tax=Sphingomonas sp. FW199 TaxID=3400217 RepID=UPI003CEB36F8